MQLEDLDKKIALTPWCYKKNLTPRCINENRGVFFCPREYVSKLETICENTSGYKYQAQMGQNHDTVALTLNALKLDR